MNTPVFVAKPASSNRPSFWLTCKMVFQAFLVSGRFWITSFGKKDLVKHTDEHILQFGKSLLQASHTSVIVTGLEHLIRGQAYVYMSNHQSLLDIPILFVTLPPSLRMVSKKQIMQIPLFGRAMRKAGFIELDRNNRTKAIQQLEVAKDRIRSGISVWVAPEGTRSKTGELQPFKKGGFHIATNLQVSIVPIWIEGAGKVLQKHSAKMTPNQTVYVHIGAPISTSGFDKNNIETLMQKVRTALTALSN